MMHYPRHLNILNKTEMETSHPIRIGLAGAGHLGRFHIECLQRIDEFNLVGFHDSDILQGRGNQE
jgi:predicted homoserine dehydrogenase-like protein